MHFEKLAVYTKAKNVLTLQSNSCPPSFLFKKYMHVALKGGLRLFTCILFAVAHTENSPNVSAVKQIHDKYMLGYLYK